MSFNTLVKHVPEQTSSRNVRSLNIILKSLKINFKRDEYLLLTSDCSAETDKVAGI